VTDAAARKGAEVRIDRLALDIPGFDPARAAPLARAVGERLAALGLSGIHGGIVLALGPVGGEDDLVARIVAALRERLV
jgi:hypothetical protein